MSEIRIGSDSSFFEEKDFFLSAAQRFLVITIINNYKNSCEWIDEYAEDVYYSSWNNLFKSFFLRSDEDFFDVDRAERIEFLRIVIYSAMDRLGRISADEFFGILVDPIYLDEISGLGSPEEIRRQFLPSVPLNELESKMVMHRVSGVFEKIIDIL